MAATRLRLVKWIAWSALLLLIALAALAAYGIEQSGIPPRRLAPYLELRSSGHNSAIVGIGSAMASGLTALDRGAPVAPLLPRLRIGAQAGVDLAAPRDGRPVLVDTAAAAAAAIAQARPGDVITLLPGTYRFGGSNAITVNQAGTSERGIAVRAEQPGTVKLEFDLVEGFHVSVPYWTFENLHIRGACGDHGRCDHAFHVVGKGAHFTARNNTIVDFNAHFKVNTQGGFHPDHGLIENNTLTNSTVRQTGQSVTVIDLVGISDWNVRGNLISDFIKQGSDGVSYGAFAKGGGSGNVFERNVVLCEQRLRGAAGQRVGMSLGGGGTAPQYCRDRRCITEQDGGIVRANLIASCSDEGIYLNRAATSKVVHNTLLDTAGIMARFAETSADLEGNVVDGRIAGSKGALLRETDNLSSTVTRLYLGSHPQRGLYRAAADLDLGWRQEAPRRDGAGPVPDLCGATRPARPAYGAFEDFGACLAP